MTQFPKWKYHAAEEGQIVDSADAEQGLPAGWFDTPAEALAAAQAAADIEAERLRLELLEKAKKTAPPAQTTTTTQPELTPEEKAQADADAEDYRKELLTKAKGLGLNLHHKLGAENILAAIAAKEAENAL